MRQFFQECLAVLFSLAMLATLALVCGFTPSGILDGQWPSTDDHPTNWYATALHPWAR